MLAALDESQRQQRQLVADASHELGTPLTSIRTNVEVLARRDDLAPAAREALLGDLVGQLGEMSGLVTGLVELASEEPTDLELVDIQLDELVDEEVARAERLAPQVSFATSLEPTVVRGVRAGSSEPSRTCSTTPSSGASRARRSRSPSRTAPCRSETTAPGSPRRTSRTSSTASTAPRRRARCRAPGSASRS